MTKRFNVGDFQVLPFRYYRSGSTYSTYYNIFNIDNWIFTTTPDHTNVSGVLMDEWHDYTGFNLFTKEDMSYIPHEYLSDETYYSLTNTFSSFELTSPANLSDNSYYDEGYNEIFYNGLIYDATS